MKTVFAKTEEVCAAWAAQEQPEGRTGSNTSFREQNLRSYGTEIGRIIKGEGTPSYLIALVSSDRWSNSTSIVQGQARTAARAAGLVVFEVPALDNSSAAIAANLAHYDTLIRESVAAIVKAVRWDTALGHRNTALQLIGTAHLFAAMFGAPFTYSGPNPLATRNSKEIF